MQADCISSYLLPATKTCNHKSPAWSCSKPRLLSFVAVFKEAPQSAGLTGPGDQRRQVGRMCPLALQRRRPSLVLCTSPPPSFSNSGHGRSRSRHLTREQHLELEDSVPTLLSLATTSIQTPTQHRHSPLSGSGP